MGIGIPADGETLAGRLHQPAGHPKAAVVISHGLFSSMASAKLTRLAQALAKAGHLALCFDHGGCGLSPGHISDTSLYRRRDEVLAAGALLRQRAPRAPLVYIGSSLGGAACLLASAQERPASLLLWSTPSDLAPLARRLKADPQTPRLPVLAREAAEVELAPVLRQASRVFFVHGEEDEVVPAAQARWGHKLAKAPKELLLLPGADHRISRLTDQMMAMAHSLAWIERFISQ